MSKILTVSLLVAGLLLNGYGVYSAFRTDDVNPLPPVKFISDAAELAKAEKSIVGTFATGREEGDRSIEIKSAGRVYFTEYGPRGESRFSNAETYRIAQHDGKICLVTDAGTLIDVPDSDAVTYFRDTYRRMP